MCNSPGRAGLSGAWLSTRCRSGDRDCSTGLTFTWIRYSSARLSPAKLPLVAPVTAFGFRWDRQWLVVNAKGKAVTQRVEPKMALVEVELPREAFDEDWQPTPDSCLETEIRPTNPDYVQGYKVTFTDAFPFLIASQGSLDALNELLKEPVPINRFRPNILVDGCHPYAEDLWKTLKISKLNFQGVKLCDRCKVKFTENISRCEVMRPLKLCDCHSPRLELHCAIIV